MSLRLDATAGTVRVLHDKGNRSRTVGMDPGGFAMVAAWIETRAALGIDRHQRGPLLCLRDGSRIESSYIRALPRALSAPSPRREHPPESDWNADRLALIFPAIRGSVWLHGSVVRTAAR